MGSWEKRQLRPHRQNPRAKFLQIGKKKMHGQGLGPAPVTPKARGWAHPPPGAGCAWMRPRFPIPLIISWLIAKQTEPRGWAGAEQLLLNPGGSPGGGSGQRGLGQPPRRGRRQQQLLVWGWWGGGSLARTPSSKGPPSTALPSPTTSGGDSRGMLRAVTSLSLPLLEGPAAHLPPEPFPQPPHPALPAQGSRAAPPGP